MKRFSVLIAALALACTAATASAATVLTTPSGLNPGDTFRFVFVTGDTIGSSSGDIETYNTFVQAQAGGATYNGNVVTWKAIGSTESVAARVNVGGFGTLVPVYRPDGVRVANDLTTNDGGLWGAAYADYGDPATTNLLAAPGNFIDGTPIAEIIALTGSDVDGTAQVNNELGNFSTATSRNFGYTSQISGQWLAAGATDLTETAWMYGVSEELTVSGGPAPVPEIDPAGLGSVLALVTGVLALVERRRLGTAAA